MLSMKSEMPKKSKQNKSNVSMCLKKAPQDFKLPTPN